jgi:hypothetical protein
MEDDMDWDRTPAAAVGRRQLTARAILLLLLLLLLMALQSFSSTMAAFSAS